MNDLEAFVALNMSADVGTIRLQRLLGAFGRPEEIFRASEEKLAAVSGISRDSARRIRSFKTGDLDKELEGARKLGLEILIPTDAAYPRNLTYMPDPPLVLYVSGRLQEEDALGIAVVGSRRASFYGLSAARQFSEELARRGFTVISGMARGIDAEAHRGALQYGRTIAVMGSGFCHPYPPENRSLARKIAENGAVISEFALDAEPLRQNFPRRNRIISGLSLGVLVVEAARNSGALITADFALEQGREVFALPGKVDCLTSFGTNRLIQQGAKLAVSVQDIIEELGPGLALPDERGAGGGGRREGRPRAGLSYQESSLYGSLSDEPHTIDELVQKTGLGIPALSHMLFLLQAKKLVAEFPGKQFAKRKERA